MNIIEIQTIQTTANIVGWFFLIASWVTPRFFKQEKTKGYGLGIAFAVTAIAFFMVALGISIAAVFNR